MRRIASLIAGVWLTTACGGSPASPAPAAVFREATLKIPQTWSADLDTGQVGAGAGDDIWFQAVRRPDERYLTPVNGATVTLMGMTAPGASGCSSATSGSSSIPTQALTSGVYLCARTGEGRLVQIRVVEPPAIFVDDADIPAITLHAVTYVKP